MGGGGSQQVLVDVNKRPDAARLLISELFWVSAAVCGLMSGIFVLKVIKKVNCSLFSCPDLNSATSLCNSWQILHFPPIRSE